jgi:RimJ/RimL family protein N-acetyltransferase
MATSMSDPVGQQLATSVIPAAVQESDWRKRLPVIAGRGVTLRELRAGDAPALLEFLATSEVAQFISPPPTTVDGFERFISWAQQEQREGRYVCFAIVPEGMSTAVGIFQVRKLEPQLGTAEWGFALGRAYWGSGIFAASARLVVDFAFETVGVHRLEARAAVANGRGNGALAKIGAVKEGLLRRSFLRHGQYHDQTLWSIVREDWRRSKAVWGDVVH